MMFTHLLRKGGAGLGTVWDRHRFLSFFLSLVSWPGPAGARPHGLVDMVGSDYFPALDFLLHRR